MPKRDQSTKDSKSATLYAKRTDTNAEAYPVLIDDKGNLEVNATICDSIVTKRCAAVHPNRSIAVESATRLVGAAFDGDTLDTNFWTATSTGTGSIVIDGEADLATGTTTDSTITLVSARKARFVTCSPMEFKAVAEFHSAPDTDNIRRLGAYDTDNGFFFQLDGSTFSVVSRTDKTGSPVDNKIDSGSFNGDSTTYTLKTTASKFLIQYSGKTVSFIVDGASVHDINLTHDLRPTTMTLPITAEVINDNGNITNNELHIFGTSIVRHGKLETNPTSYYHALGTTSGINLKLTAGAVQGVILNNCENGAVVTLSDSVTDLTDTLWAFTSGVKFTTPTSLDFKGLPFSTGLRLTVSDDDASITVIYE